MPESTYFRHIRRKHGRLFRERWAIGHARTHAHPEMISRQAKNCPPNKQQIARLDCVYLLQA